MSILTAFDPDSPEILRPAGAVAGFPETLLAAFSPEFTPVLRALAEVQPVDFLRCGCKIPIYRFSYKDQVLGFYCSAPGGAPAAALLEEVLAKGARRVLYFGACGRLDNTLAGGELLVPAAAYRDEGTSYHYAPPGDFLQIPTAARLAQIFDELGVPYRRGKTWTTDGVYRETRGNRARRVRDGCCAVEMECASVMAVGQFRGAEVFQFLYGADSVLDGEWEEGLLAGLPRSLRERILRVALEAACRLDSAPPAAGTGRPGPTR